MAVVARQLFGTDGVRGRAGHFLTADLALALARTAVARLDAERPQVLIIRDTRESGEMLESAIAAGVAAAGGDAWLAGVLPTPAAPLLVRRHGLDLAAVISASHNPYEDNGIKLFAADGFKLHDDTEHEIEAALETAPPPPPHIGRIRPFDGALEDYLQQLSERFSGLELSGLRVLLDCANGATFQAAPEIFRRLGANVDVIADQPDGMNINHGCGSTHLDGVVRARRGRRLRRRVRVRRRRRSGARGGRPRRDRRRRRADRARRASPARRRPAARQRRGGHGHDQLRLPPRDGGGGHRGRDHRRRRPLRARRAPPARLGARRRAVRPHHRPRLRAVRRRDRERAAHARGARRAGPGRPGRDGEAAPAPGQHPRRRPATDSPPRWPTPGWRRRWHASTRG